MQQAYANPAAASISNDLIFLGVAATVFMFLEAKRLQAAEEQAAVGGSTAPAMPRSASASVPA
ncbi:MAG: DUF2834 domain-containing protein [Rubrivivax sp.]|nr:MAG: DUF2834 domain-containing protein [Rubrivivax sp.]